MTLTQIEKRVKVLEKRVQGLARAKPPPDRAWYRTQAGRFADDPIFDQIVKLGRAYRKSLAPAPGSKRS